MIIEKPFLNIPHIWKELIPEMMELGQEKCIFDIYRQIQYSIIEDDVLKTFVIPSQYLTRNDDKSFHRGKTLTETGGFLKYQSEVENISNAPGMKEYQKEHSIIICDSTTVKYKLVNGELTYEVVDPHNYNAADFYNFFAENEDATDET